MPMEVLRETYPFPVAKVLRKTLITHRDFKDATSDLIGALQVHIVMGNLPTASGKIAQQQSQLSIRTTN